MWLSKAVFKKAWSRLAQRKSDWAFFRVVVVNSCRQSIWVAGIGLSLRVKPRGFTCSSLQRRPPNLQVENFTTSERRTTIFGTCDGDRESFGDLKLPEFKSVRPNKTPALFRLSSVSRANDVADLVDDLGDGHVGCVDDLSVVGWFHGSVSSGFVSFITLP